MKIWKQWGCNAKRSPLQEPVGVLFECLPPSHAKRTKEESLSVIHPINDSFGTALDHPAQSHSRKLLDYGNQVGMHVEKQASPLQVLM